MKRLSAVAVFLLGMSAAVHAQNLFPAPVANDNAAIDFALTSASSRPAVARPDPSAPFYTASSGASFSSAFGSDSLSAPVAIAAFPATPYAEPASTAVPAVPVPKYNYKGNDRRWQLGLGFAFVRFRSSVYIASAVGINSSLSYFFKDWLAIEGAITSAFAPTIYQNEHIKYVGYGAGPKISLGHDRLEPWVHVLAGGMHILPQTGLGGQNSFEVLAGGGVDYSLVPQFAVRLEADWVNTRAFGQTQNNGQATLGVVFHF